MKNYNLPALGGGAGLRHAHFQSIIDSKPDFSWFEVISEDFMGFGGWEREAVMEIKKHYPLIGHGVCLSVGSTDPLDMEYLKNLRIFLDEIDSPWASDHLCFTMVDHTNLNELIPIPFTNEAVQNCAERIQIVQDVLERPFLVENVTRYITVSDREMSEVEFISEVLEKANCGLLLDVTNVHLNAQYHDYDAYEFISALPLERVGQMHLAGSKPLASGEIIDSHNAPVSKETWDLFEHAIRLVGNTSVLIEWDNDLPSVDALLAETKLADQHIERTLQKAA